MDDSLLFVLKSWHWHLSSSHFPPLQGPRAERLCYRRVNCRSAALCRPSSFPPSVSHYKFLCDSNPYFWVLHNEPGANLAALLIKLHVEVAGGISELFTHLEDFFFFFFPSQLCASHQSIPTEICSNCHPHHVLINCTGDIYVSGKRALTRFLIKWWNKVVNQGFFFFFFFYDREWRTKDTPAPQRLIF